MQQKSRRVKLRSREWEPWEGVVGGHLRSPCEMSVAEPREGRVVGSRGQVTKTCQPRENFGRPLSGFGLVGGQWPRGSAKKNGETDVQSASLYRRGSASLWNERLLPGSFSVT